MRWKSPSDRAQFWLLAPVILPIVAIAVPPILAMVGLGWIVGKIFPRHDWRPWFAWRPVKFDEWPNNRWAWLERVERRRNGILDHSYKQFGDNRWHRDGPYSPTTQPEGE